MKIHASGLDPFFDENSQILILESFPSVKSREVGFYYGNKTNRFYEVLSAVFNDDIPTSIEEKKMFLKRHHIALSDVVKECDISGSADESIENVKSNKDVIDMIRSTCDIRQVFTTGRKAFSLYHEYIGDDAVYLPSTSAAYPIAIDKLIEKYRETMLATMKKLI